MKINDERDGLGVRMDRNARRWIRRWMSIAWGIVMLVLFWAAVGQLIYALEEITR